MKSRYQFLLILALLLWQAPNVRGQKILPITTKTACSTDVRPAVSLPIAPPAATNGSK